MKLAQLLLALMVTAAAAQAQIRLPSLPLPGAPLSSVPQSLSPVESGTLEHLSEVRRFNIRQLIRANRRTVDTDPHGEPIVRSEILALGIADEALAQAESRGFVVDRQQTIAAADIRLLVFKAPVGLSTQKALRELRDADPKGLYDYNHIYSGGGAVSADPSPTEAQQNNLPSGARTPTYPYWLVGYRHRRHTPGISRLAAAHVGLRRAAITERSRYGGCLAPGRACECRAVRSGCVLRRSDGRRGRRDRGCLWLDGAGASLGHQREFSGSQEYSARTCRERPPRSRPCAGRGSR